MSDKAKIAIIGTGWWATQAHIPTLKDNPRAEIVLVDRNPAALHKASTGYDISHAYTSLAEARDAHPDIRGAVVAVPHHAHYAVAREVLESGLQLLLEKPMTLYAWEAKELVELAEQKGLEILMG